MTNKRVTKTCVACGETKLNNQRFFREHRRTCRECENDRTKTYYQRRKVKVLTYYGGGKTACVECGESRIDCLSIDHIDGGGLKHRRSLGISSGSRFYGWLVNEGFPPGYQTLCMNCQYLKKHKREEF